MRQTCSTQPSLAERGARPLSQMLLRGGVALLALPLALTPADAYSTHRPASGPSVRSAPQARAHSSASHSSRRLASSSRKRRRQTRSVKARKSTFSRRLAALRPAPSRVEEIQRALIQAGELHEEPTGIWDQQTKEAMQRYQKANGFPVTGLPDAKSLMKLGLGPHPLPDDVQPQPGPSPSPSPSFE
jgi:hypothetical protein